jgi:hypothetical protein
MKSTGGKPPVLGRTGKAGIGLALAGALMMVCSAQSQPALPGAEPMKKRSVEEWRKQFPFAPLGDRLDYEAKRAPDDKPVDLGAEAKKRLDALEQSETPRRWHLRVEALKKLHSQEAEQFVKREGFGLERMPTASTRNLELPPAPTLLPGKVGYPLSMIENDPLTTLPATGAGPVGNSRMLSVDSLSQLHRSSRGSFVSPDSTGYVKSKMEIAGFEPHQFRFDPSAYLLNPPKGPKEPPAKEKWVMRRLELVSLLKYEKPAVYISEHLPRMQDLKDTPLRAVSAFEAKGLKQLQAGEDLVTDSTTNRIRMLGSLRATKQCLECHSAKRGDLLGAFSYELLRDPPLQAP